MNHRKYVLIAVLFAGYLGLLLCPASAQPALHRQPLAEQQPFTESEAVAYGLVHNPGLRAQRSFIGVIEGEVINEAILQDAIIGAAVEREREREREVGEDDETSIARSRRFAASQGFGIAAQRPFEILAARAELDAVRLEVAEAEIDLAREIKNAVAEYLAATDALAEIHNVIYKAKPPMWEATAGKPNDRRRTLMGFLFFQQSFPENSLERLEAETELNNLLGLPPDTRLYITGNLDPEPLPISYEELTQSIFSRSVELRVALAELRAARFGLELAMRDKVPEVEVEYSNRRVRGESGKVVRSSETGIGAGLNLFRQFVEQNRGEVYSAKKAVEAAEHGAQATRWEVEAELFELYQVLNLTRSRILIFEHGFLAQLETLLLEIDVEDYEEGNIDMDTWERDFNRYHSRGEQLIAIKTEYRKTLNTLEFLAGGSFSSSVQVAMETSDLEDDPAGYLKGLCLKIGRGLGTIALSPIEIPAGWYGYTLDRGVWGAVFGPYEGTVTAVTRAAGGALDVVTAPIPWPLERMKPVSLPIWGENPWTGSWSLSYVHPAYQEAYVPLRDQAELTEGGR